MYHYFKHLEILDDIPVLDIKLPILEEISHLNNTADMALQEVEDAAKLEL